jgi:hypothetical protein
MPDYPRQEWVVPVAQHIADAIRLLQAQGRNADAHLMLQDIDRVFRRAIMSIGSVPGGDVQREVERLIGEDGLTVKEALDRAGC